MYYLLRALAKVALVGLGGVVVTLAFSTVESWYPGTGASTRGPAESTVVASVESCQRIGPVSGHGFGFWWECRFVAHEPGGGIRRAMVGRSILSPADAGRDVELQQACEGADCVYGRPVPWALTTAFLAVRVIDRLVMVLFVGWMLVWLARGIAPERYWAFVSRRAQKWWPSSG